MFLNTLVWTRTEFYKYNIHNLYWILIRCESIWNLIIIISCFYFSQYYLYYYVHNTHIRIIYLCRLSLKWRFYDFSPLKVLESSWLYVELYRACSWTHFCWTWIHLFLHRNPVIIEFAVVLFLDTNLLFPLLNVVIFIFISLNKTRPF